MEEQEEKDGDIQEVKKPWYKKLRNRIIIAVGLVLLFMVLFPIIFEDAITRRVVNEVNKNLVAPIEYSDSRLSFFDYFPGLTLSFEDLKIRGSDDVEAAPFVDMESFTFKVNWLTLLFKKHIDIDGIILKKPVIRMRVDEDGIPNYNIVKKRENKQGKFRDDLEREKIFFKMKMLWMDRAEVSMVDKSRDIDLQLHNFELKGKGKNRGEDLYMESRSSIEEVDLVYKGFSYFNDRTLESEHLTIFRRNEVSLIFERNDVSFNNLRFDFKGQLDFLPQAARIDLVLNTAPEDLATMFAALPEPMSAWQEEKGVEVSGQATASLSIKGMSKKSEGLKPDLEFQFNWQDGTMVPREVQEPVQDIYMDMHVLLPGLNTEKAKITLDTLNFVRGDNYLKGHVTLEKDSLVTHMEGNVQTRIDLEKFTRSLAVDSVSLKGLLYSDLNFNGVYDSVNKRYPRLSGSLLLKDGELKTRHYPKPVEDIQVAMEVYHDGKDPRSARLTISSAEFLFEDERFASTAEFQDLTNIRFDVSGKGVLRLGRLNRVFAKEDFDLDGRVAMDMSISGRERSLKKENYDQIDARGTMELEDITLESPFLKYPVNVDKGVFSFKRGSMTFDDFYGGYARTTFRMNGELRHFIKHFLKDNQVIQGRFAVAVDEIHVEDFLIKKGEDIAKDSIAVAQNQKIQADSLKAGVLQVPNLIDVTLDYSAKAVHWDKLHIENMNGLVAIVQGGLFIKNGQINIIETSAGLDGVYKNFGTDKAFFEYDIQVNNFDVGKAYKEVEMFRELAPGAEHASGIVGLNYRISGVLDEDMKVIYPSLEGGGVLTLRDIRVKNHEVLDEVGKSTANKRFEDTQFEEVKIRTRISHNVVDIDPFKFRVMPYRLTMQGQTSLDRKMNLRIRVGIPPFGLIGIPIKITGKEPFLKVRLGKKTKKLDEKFYDEDGISDLRMAQFIAFKDSLTSDMSIGEVQKMKARIKNTPPGAFRPPGAKSPRDFELRLQKN